ncbi:MAG: NAD(P)-binding domain-containing protein [Atopostipes sp.]|nr:NAD(P)-binding domain-containing protein [Atopostipes sp.]
MHNKKIALLEDLPADKIKELKKVASDYELVDSLEGNHLEDIEIVFGWNEEVKDFVESDQSQLKWIQSVWAGVDSLPLELLNQKGIDLTSGSGTNAHAVAESTMAMISSIGRQIVTSVREQEKKNWFVSEKDYELKGKEILIVGAGKIGENIGRLAQAFLMKTVGVNRSGSKVNYMDEQYLQDELGNIIHKADIIVNVLPATIETENLFDQNLFQKMKETAIFVNVGRGESVVMDDLMAALDKKEISWAALDVFEEEPLASDHPLWNYGNVLITPHIAGQVENQLDYLFPIFLDNLKAYLAGKDFPHNKIDWEQGY